MTISSILCGVDFSRESPRVLHAALTLAQQEGARLTVVHVLDPLLVQAARIKFEEGVLEKTADDDLRALIVDAAATAGVEPGEVSRHVRVGQAHAEILAEAARIHADLLMIGTHGFSGVRKMCFGSTAAQVLAHSATPVLALPPETHDPADGAAIGGAAEREAAPPLPLRRVLVAVDFTEACMRAVREAAALAQRWQLSLTLLHAVPGGPQIDRWKTFLDADQEQRIQRARHELELMAEELSRAPLEERRLPVTVVAVGGSPEDVIACVAAEERGTLVVMGVRTARLLGPRPGSTAYRLLCLTSMPVLIIPMVAAAAERRRAADAPSGRRDAPPRAHIQTAGERQV